METARMPEGGMKPGKVTMVFLRAVGIGCSLFIVINLFYLFSPSTWTVGSILLTCMCIMGFAFNPLSRKNIWIRAIDMVLILASTAVTIYIAVNLDRLKWWGATFPTTTDLMFYVGGSLIVLELTRRTTGWALTTVVLGALAYAFFGQHLSGLLQHPGYTHQRILGVTYSENGIFGAPLMVTIRYIYLFVLFGAFVKRTGVGDFLFDLAKAVAGRTRGGPAKVAVISSSLFGTISGSAIANVMVDGWLTIGMMKRVGYKPEFAAAVEATASTGGQWTPPVMAGTAFLICEYVGVPYVEVAIGAAIPAFFYYWCLLLQIDLEAVKLGLKGLPPEEIPRFWPVLRRGAYNFLPLVVLIVDLVVLGHSIVHAGLLAILACIVVSWVRKDTRMGPKQALAALYEGARDSVLVTAACASAGIIVGVVGLTGAGPRLSSAMVEMSFGIGLLLVLLTGLVALILGMGMPTGPAYIICAAIMAPSLILLGFSPFASHMLIFYYSIINCITPPVALAAYAAAGIAGADPMKVGLIASRLGIMSYFVPILFIYNQELLCKGPVTTVLFSSCIMTIGIFVLAMGVVGYCYVGGFQFNIWRRILFLAAAGCLMAGVGVGRAGLLVLGTLIAISALASHSGIREWVRGVPAMRKAGAGASLPK